MPQQEPSVVEPQTIQYELLVRDRTGEQMNPCNFAAYSDEDACKLAAAYLEIPMLSEAYFSSHGFFRLRRKDGPQLFPKLDS